MVFKRGVARTPLQKTREMVWPSSGFRRSLIYTWRRLTRLQATPHAIALGFAIGVFMSFSPFLGLHLVLSGVTAWMLRGHIAASLIGNFLGNPISYPFMWAVVYQCGTLMLGQSGDIAITTPAFSMSDIASGAWEIFLPMLAGSIPVGLGMALLFYFPIKAGVTRYQASRRARFGVPT